MGKSIIFVFSGTGNSLWAAKRISEELENCEIISMGCHTEYALPDEYDAIGFVYPTYYRGYPQGFGTLFHGLIFKTTKTPTFLPLLPAEALPPPAMRPLKCATCCGKKASCSATLKSSICFQTILFSMKCGTPSKRKRSNRPVIWSRSSLPL